MERRQMLSLWAAGAVTSLALAVLVGVTLGSRTPQEGKEGRAAREASAEQAERTVVYDPQSYLGFDPQAFYVPPRVSEVRVDEGHALRDCAMEYAPSASEATDATLFADAGHRIGLGPVFGDRGYHAHLVSGGKDRVFKPDAKGTLVLEPGAAPARIVLVTTPFTVEYPDARVFIPPYTMSLRVLGADQMRGMVGAQPFARAVKPSEQDVADLFVATMPRSDSEFVFAAYDMSGKRKDLETGLWLGASSRFILQPTFRAWVEEGGRVTQKVEILPFPPTAGYAAAGTETFDVETPAGALAQVSVPPRPHVDMPDTSVEPLPAVNVTATFYGFPKGAPFRVVTGQGFAHPGKPVVSVESKEHAQELTYQVTSMAAERDPEGRPIPRTAFYSLRVSRRWEKEGGRMIADLVTAPPPSPLGDRVPYVPTTKLLHAKIVRLGGVGSSAVPGSAYNPLFAGVMADGMVRAALGMRDVIKPAKAKGSGTNVVVNNFINTEGGLPAGPSGVFMASGRGGDAEWMGRWANERYQEDLQRAREGAEGNGSPLVGRGWNGAPAAGQR